MTALSGVVGRAFYGGFAGMRAIQDAAVEPIVRGDDVLVLSRTGSGKTEAVTAPLIERYGRAARQAQGVSLIHITPTRALANDLLRRLEPPLDILGYSVGIRHGERNDLSGSERPDLLITTPESLDVMLSSGEISLKSVRAVVLDEVHLTYNTQRGFQTAVLLKRLQGVAVDAVQVIGLSATVATPSDIWTFFRPGHPFTAVQEQVDKPIDYHICEAPTGADLITLLNTIGSGGRCKALLFANSRRECDTLGTELTGKTVFENRVFVHHSSLNRDERLQTEQMFLRSGTALCIATSTLELGIDIGDIDIVILYGRPQGWESFVQRIGRGNRRSNKTNVACVLPARDGNPFLSVLGFEALVSQVRSGRIERERPMDVYGAAVQQIMSLLLASGGSFERVRDIAAIFSAWTHLDRQVVEQIMSSLADQAYLAPHGFLNRYGAGERLHQLHSLRLIWGNFPARSREVRLTVSGREMGRIPASNLLRLQPGSNIRFASRFWRVRRVLPDEIELESTRDTSGLEVTYGGGRVPLDPTNVEEMLRLLESGVSGDAIATTTRAWFIRQAEKIHPYVSWDKLPTARDEKGYHYFTFAGSVVNGAIARWSGTAAFEVGEVELITQSPIDFSALPEDMHILEPCACEAMRLPEGLTVFQALLPPDLLERELIEAWRKTPVYARSLGRLRAASSLVVPIQDIRVLAG